MKHAATVQSLLLVFEESILPTHRSKFVQFVLFFASGRAHGLGYALTSKLVEVLRDDSRPKVMIRIMMESSSRILEAL